MKNFKTKKSTFKRVISLTITIILLLSATTQVYAYIPSGVTGSGLYGNYVTRGKSNWCWAASAENINRWNNTPSLTQWSAVNYIKGTPSEPFPNVSGDEIDTLRAAGYISNYSSTFINDYLQYDDICDQIYSYQHTIIGMLFPIMSSGSIGHAVLIDAWYNPNGINRITYFDPGTGRNIDINYSDFCCNYYSGYVCLSHIHKL